MKPAKIRGLGARRSAAVLLPVMLALLGTLTALAAASGFMKTSGAKASVVDSFAVFRQERVAKLQKDEYRDLDGDGVVERYRLQDGCLTVKAESGTIWRSPGEWWVDYFELADADNDGKADLALSVWKPGSFGRQKPPWVDGEDRSVRNHLFVLGLTGGAVKPKWQSSNLDRPILEMSLRDADGDGQNELLVLEGDYSDPDYRHRAVWRWNGWGFSMLDVPGVLGSSGCGAGVLESNGRLGVPDTPTNFGLWYLVPQTFMPRCTACNNDRFADVCQPRPKAISKD